MTMKTIWIIPYLFMLWNTQCFDYGDQKSWGGVCETGKIQTPIDLTIKNLKICPHHGYYKITFLHEDFPVAFKGNDVSIDAEKKAFAFFVNEKEMKYEAYESYNAHFHTPSEHRINQISFEAEMHIKLRPTTFDMLPPEALGEYQNFDFSQFQESNHFHAVIGVFFRNSSWVQQDFFDRASYPKDVEFSNFSSETVSWNLANMMGGLSSQFWYEYIGSTTTPPCIEDVRWLITQRAVLIKPENLKKLESLKLINPNNRSLQSRNDRQLNLLADICHKLG